MNLQLVPAKPAAGGQRGNCSHNHADLGEFGHLLATDGGTLGADFGAALVLNAFFFGGLGGGDAPAFLFHALGGLALFAADFLGGLTFFFACATFGLLAVTLFGVFGSFT